MADNDAGETTLKLLSAEHLLRMINSIHGIVFTLDRDLKCTGIYGKWMSREGLDVDEFMGKTAHEVLSSEEAKVHEEANRRALAGEHVLYAWTTATPHGLRYFQSSLSPLEGRHGEIVGVVGICCEVTEQKRVEDDLRKSEEGLRKAYAELLQVQEELIRTEKMRAIGEMSAGVAHQFNNILMMVHGLAELAQLHLREPDRLQEYLEKIKVSTDDGMQIVQRIQAYLKRSSATEVGSVSVNDVIRVSVQITQPRWKDEMERSGRNIVLNMDLQNTPRVKGKESELREVLVNMILNAVDAMPGGGTLALNTCLEEEKVVIRVSDTGIGMSADIQSKLFVPFFTTKVQRGSGLGLSICNNIVTQMRGTIRVESAEGAGTTFTIELPVLKAGEESAPKHESTKFKLPQKTFRVMIVDDEPLVCDVLRGFLEEEKLTVSSFVHPREALEALEKNPVDVLITDLGMPVMTGWEVLKEAKKIQPGVKTILLTGWGAAISNEESASKGADILLSKPVEFKHLIKSVYRLMS